MPFTSHTPHTKPTRPNSINSNVCYDCGYVHGGRHMGAHYMTPRPRDVQAIDDEGIAYTTAEAEERGLPINTSHGWCEACTRVNEEHMTAQNERRIATRESLKQAESAGAKAYWPIPEAHEPVPEAHTPVPEAHEPIPEAVTETEEG